MNGTTKRALVAVAVSGLVVTVASATAFAWCGGHQELHGALPELTTPKGGATEVAGVRVYRHAEPTAIENGARQQPSTETPAPAPAQEASEENTPPPSATQRVARTAPAVGAATTHTHEFDTIDHTHDFDTAPDLPRVEPVPVSCDAGTEFDPYSGQCVFDDGDDDSLEAGPYHDHAYDVPAHDHTHDVPAHDHTHDIADWVYVILHTPDCEGKNFPAWWFDFV